MEERTLRTIAKSIKYQTLFARAKDMGNIKIFNNDTEFSKIQVIFLQWIQVYSSLYQDLIMGEQFINEEVMEDFMNCDNYLFYRSKKYETKNQSKIQKKKTDNTGNIPGVIFV